MARNIELLEQVMQHIEDHPEQHDQAEWFHPCGTAACFAGWACWLTGWRLVSGCETKISRGGRTSWVDYVAADELGLTEAEAGVLFNAVNSRPMLALMVKDLVNGESLRDCDDYQREAVTA